MELKRKMMLYKKDGHRVLIVPFMELKLFSVQIIELSITVLIVPFMELKQARK